MPRIELDNISEETKKHLSEWYVEQWKRGREKKRDELHTDRDDLKVIYIDDEPIIEYTSQDEGHILGFGKKIEEELREAGIIFEKRKEPLGPVIFRKFLR
jgi:hypothetical protein